MASTTEMREKSEAVLAELTDLGLTLARDLHARALAASDDKAAADLALAFHRISRSVRQSLALHSRLEREARLADREIRQDHDRETLVRVHRKRDQVRRALSPLLWTEYEHDDEDEAEDRLETLEALLMDESADPDAFLAAPLETCIEHVRTALGLPANDPAIAPEAPTPEEHRSSG